jgi:hypothetical protein
VGKHYVPQEYLRGFSADDDRSTIWQYDKRACRWSRAAITKVAQERDFYPAEVEVELERHVEGPGHRALKTLRGGAVLSPSERDELLLYIAVMLMRVPRKRRKGHESVPDVLQSTMGRFRDELAALRGAANLERVDTTLRLLDDLESKYAIEPPPEVLEQIASPWPSTNIAEAVRTMTWRLVQIPRSHYVVTGDNPAYFFESLGLGRKESELTFPISPQLVLLGNRQGNPGEALMAQASVSIAKELNRRLISGSERFVFSHKKAAWAATVALRPSPVLNRIQW